MQLTCYFAPLVAKSGGKGGENFGKFDADMYFQCKNERI
jgi:hypothetical protein